MTEEVAGLTVISFSQHFSFLQEKVPDDGEVETKAIIKTLLVVNPKRVHNSSSSSTSFLTSSIGRLRPARTISPALCPSSRQFKLMLELCVKVNGQPQFGPLAIKLSSLGLWKDSIHVSFA